MITVQIVGDLSYAWEIMDRYVIFAHTHGSEQNLRFAEYREP